MRKEGVLYSGQGAKEVASGRSAAEFFNPLTGEEVTISKEQESLYLELAGLAASAEAAPVNGGYFVKASMLTENGVMVAGGNQEIALPIADGIMSSFPDTISHGETACLSAAFQADASAAAQISGLIRESENDGVISQELTAAMQFIEAVCFQVEEAGLARMCGGCRDRLRPYCTQQCVVLTASQDLGQLTILPLLEYYCDHYQQISVSELESWTFEAGRDCLQQAATALESAYAPHIKNPSLVYGAAITGLDSAGAAAYWRGSYSGDDSYHPTLPIKAAESVFTNTDRPDLKKISGLTVVAYSSDEKSKQFPPYVPYLDRQHLLEFEKKQFPLLVEAESLPILLARVDGQGDVQSAWKTNSEQWLPHPFIFY